MFAVGFLLFWFGFLILACVSIVKQEGFLPTLFTLPLWLAGFFIIYKIFIKDDF